MTTAPARQRLTKQARRASLLDAAEVVFGEVGYHGATMELIAARSGVARSLLYEHFGSLDDVYVECVRAARADLQARFVAASAVHDGDPTRQLRAVAEAYFGFVQERGGGWEVLSGHGYVPAGPVGAIATELRFQAADQLAALAVAARPELDPDEVNAFAHVVSGGGEQLARWWRRHPDVPLEVVCDRLMAVVWTGLGALVASR